MRQGLVNVHLLTRTAALAAAYLASLDERFVGPRPDPAQLRDALGAALPETGADPVAILDDLARTADPGLVATAGGRYFGFVVGATLPSALAADWLSSAWDQNAGFHALSPAAAAIEEVVARWLLDLLGLSPDAAVGFVTGGQMANVTGLAAARHRVLERVGWDVASRGLNGAPRVRVIASAEAHGTIDRSLALLGFGADCAERVACDDNGAMRAEAFAALLAADDDVERPTIVCAQAGNVDTGAFDPLAEIAPLCNARDAWLHVDGAFGLWASASPESRHLTAGAELADSLGVDGHKWLNVPYDSGIVIVRDHDALMSAMNYRGAYLVRGEGARDGSAYVPESSRRARATPMYAALRELGRDGVAQLVNRCCAHARRMAELLRAGGMRVLNDVVLNQVLVVPETPAGRDAAEFVDAFIARVQADGTCWAGRTVWQGRVAMRISVSSWRTTGDDIERSAEAMLRCLAEERGA